MLILIKTFLIHPPKTAIGTFLASIYPLKLKELDIYTAINEYFNC